MPETRERIPDDARRFTADKDSHFLALRGLGGGINGRQKPARTGAKNNAAPMMYAVSVIMDFSGFGLELEAATGRDHHAAPGNRHRFRV
jgi:hypothetical protein